MAGYSIAGLRAARRCESAFREEVMLFPVILTWGFVLTIDLPEMLSALYPRD